VELVSRKDEFQLELLSSFVFPIADMAKMQKFKWNSSLAETRKLFPLIVLK
jgi:hypothetical protein